MDGSRFLAPKVPGGLLSAIQGLLTASETLVIQAITSGTYFHINEVPTPAVDGTVTDFTLVDTPNPTTSLEVYLNGTKQTITTNYTLSGNTLTMVSAPQLGDDFKVNYIVSPV